MKKSSGIFVLVWAVLLLLPMANTPTAYAQTGIVGGGGPLYEPGAFRAVDAQLGQTLGWPGRVWFSANYADQGLGFEGSYLTIGAKTRLFEDSLDGRWLFEGRGHISEEGGFFGNFGLERVFTVQAANADVSLGAWFDYDDDQNGFGSADTLEAVGVTAQIKSRNFDLIANGYFPIGGSDSTLGDPTGASSFFGNSIALVPGIDSGLQGFDVTLRTRPEQLAFVNGSFDFGGYGYQSDLVDFFGGGRLRLNMQLLGGAIVSGEINYDDRFDVSGLVGITFLWGANARGHEYSAIGRDLDRTVRNDHIVRFNQDVILAIDPDTGAPYNVFHVNNLADPSGDGSFESPFASLAEAEAASAEDDIIFVDEGDGTANNYDTGIALQDGQLLLGDGVRHLIPIANGPQFGSVFELSNDQDGIRPTITGTNNGAAVTLASRNTVRGFVIDGTAAPGGMSTGIFGSAGVVNDGGIIEDNTIFGAILSGVSVNNLEGDWTFARNDIQNNGFSGISLINACDPDSVFTFDSNIVSNNTLGNGIELINYDATAVIFNNNVTDGNGQNGVLLQNFKGDPNAGVEIAFDMHTARSNTGSGISIEGGSGNISITNSIIGTDFNDTFFLPGDIQPFTGNLGPGINIVDFTTPGDNLILISGNEINDNGGGAGAGINLELNEGFAQALITGNQVDANGIGIQASANTTGGAATTLDVMVLDNQSFAGNNADGLRFVSQGSALLNVTVDQTDGANLIVAGNGNDGIGFLIEGDSSVRASIRNVFSTVNGGDGIFGQVLNDGQLTLLVEDSVIGTDSDPIAGLLVGGGNTNGLNFNIDTNGGGRINTLIIRNVDVNDNVFNGFLLNTGTGTLTDVAITNSNFGNPFLGNTIFGGPNTDGVLDGVNPNMLPDGGFGEGITINAVGAGGITNPQVDNRTRLLLQGNTIDRFTFAGVSLNSAGDANLLADINSNVISNNGDGVVNVMAPMQPDPPFEDGIDLNATGESVLSARITSNNLTGGLGNALGAFADDTAVVNALVVGNNLGNNLGPDVFGTNDGAGSELNLAFSNNSVDSSLFVNMGAAVAFRVELDGFTNGPLFANPLPANVTPVGFGNFVEPAIEAEEFAFAADGFPASPPNFP